MKALPRAGIAQCSWNAHVDKAVAAGTPEDVVRDLATGKKPRFKTA